MRGSCERIKIVLITDVEVAVTYAPWADPLDALEGAVVSGCVWIGDSCVGAVTDEIDIPLISEDDGEALYILEDVEIVIDNAVDNVFYTPIVFRDSTVEVDAFVGVVPYTIVVQGTETSSVSVKSMSFELVIDPVSREADPALPSISMTTSAHWDGHAYYVDAGESFTVSVRGGAFGGGGVVVGIELPDGRVEWETFPGGDVGVIEVEWQTGFNPEYLGFVGFVADMSTGQEVEMVLSVAVRPPLPPLWMHTLTALRNPVAPGETTIVTAEGQGQGPLQLVVDFTPEEGMGQGPGSYTVTGSGTVRAELPIGPFTGPGKVHIFAELSGSDYTYVSSLGTFLIVVSPNEPPVAVASADRSVVAINANVSFTGDQSSDPEGGALTYLWEFGDGETSTDANPTHSYEDGGHYTIALTVTDPEDAEGTDTVEVTAVEVTFDTDPVMVGVSKTETVTATVVPSDAYGEVSFGTVDVSIATVSPATASSNEQELTVTGVKMGTTTLQAEVGYEPCGSAAISVGQMIALRITPNYAYFVPGEQVTYTAVAFAKVQGHPFIPKDYSPDLSTAIGAEVTVGNAKGIYLGPTPATWGLNAAPDFFIPEGEPTGGVPSVIVEAALDAEGEMSPLLHAHGCEADDAGGEAVVVVITGTDAVTDGRLGGEFRATVKNGTAARYEWSFEFPGLHFKAKEEPTIAFTPEDAQTTALSKIWWYADKPKEETYAPSGTVAYVIKCTVTLDDGKKVVGKKSLAVSVPSGKQGSTILQFSGKLSYKVYPTVDGKKVTYNIRNLWYGSLKRVPVPKLRPTVIGTQWEDKARKHESYHVAQFEGTKAPDLTSYYKIDPNMIYQLSVPPYVHQMSRKSAATGDMTPAQIKAIVDAEAAAVVETALATYTKHENGRFLTERIMKADKLEEIEKPAYKEHQDEAPVQFVHPSLEPWRLYNSFR